MKRKEMGITLIALIITVIIMLILAGVVIHLTIGENGIFEKSEDSAQVYNKEEATEQMNMKITGLQIESYTKKQRLPSLQELADGLCEDEEMEYVLLESKTVASLDKVTVGERQSIFTKIKKYPYEFEINSSLQLASIDGVEIATDNTITVDKAEYEQLKKDVEELKANSNLENTKPKLIATIDKNFGKATGTFDMASYDINIEEEAQELLEYNATDKNIEIKESGFYVVEMYAKVGRQGSCWGSNHITYYIEGEEAGIAESYGNNGSNGSDTNSINMYLTKGQHISFNNNISISGSVGSGTTSIIKIRIFKISK